MSGVVTVLRDRLKTVISAMEYEFVGCELLRQGRYSLLRIFIDSPKGITVDDCASVSRQVSAMLDVEDPIAERYTLEVSSPGIDRPLFELEQYAKFVDHRIKVRLNVPINNRRNLVGVLRQVEGEQIELVVGEESIMLPFSNIEKANLIMDKLG